MHTRIWASKVTALLLYALTVLILISGCGDGDSDATATPASAGPADLQLTEADNGSTFDAQVGEVLAISLPANPTTGYEWAVASVNSGIVTYEGSTYTSMTGGVVGGGGTDELRFRAVRTGSTEIELKYWRSWEGDSSISDTFSVTIDVN